MPKDPIGESWAGSTYNGFAGHAATAQPELRASPPPQGGRNRNLLIGGLAGAVALGLVLGFWARPQFGDDGRERGPMTPVRTAQTPGATDLPAVPVEIARPKPPPMPRADGPLEVLPPDLARAAPAPVAPPPPVVVPAPAPQPAPETARAPEPAPWTIPAEPPRETARPSFNCRYARSPSEQMVCSDPELAAADRRLNSAFERAIAAGVPRRELRAEQDDWLAIREDAARRSRRAVASVYDQRIRELNEMAEDGAY